MRKGQRIQLDVVSNSTPKVSRILWQVIPGHVNLQLTLKKSSGTGACGRRDCACRAEEFGNAASDGLGELS